MTTKKSAKVTDPRFEILLHPPAGYPDEPVTLDPPGSRSPDEDQDGAIARARAALATCPIGSRVVVAKVTASAKRTVFEATRTAAGVVEGRHHVAAKVPPIVKAARG